MSPFLCFSFIQLPSFNFIILPLLLLLSMQICFLLVCFRWDFRLVPVLFTCTEDRAGESLSQARLNVSSVTRWHFFSHNVGLVAVAAKRISSKSQVANDKMFVDFYFMYTNRLSTPSVSLCIKLHLIRFYSFHTL